MFNIVYEFVSRLRDVGCENVQYVTSFRCHFHHQLFFFQGRVGRSESVECKNI